MNLNLKRIFAIFLILIGITTLAYAFTKIWIIHNTGDIFNSGVEVYWFANLTNPVTVIAWEGLFPGNTTIRTVYLHNPGNSPISINWTIHNWNPVEAEQYVLVTLPANQTLQGNETSRVDIGLRIGDDVVNTNITSYQFDIIVTGE